MIKPIFYNNYDNYDKTMKYKKKKGDKTRTKLWQTGTKQNAHKLPEIVKKLDNEKQGRIMFSVDVIIQLKDE